MQEAGASSASLPARMTSLCFLTSAAAHGLRIGLSILPIGMRSLPETFTSAPGPVPGLGGAKSKALPVRIQGPEKSGIAGSPAAVSGRRVATVTADRKRADR